MTTTVIRTNPPELEQRQSRFIETVSHEMRTPLTALKVSLGVLDENLPGDLTPTLRRLVKNAIKSTARLESAVSDLLDLANLEAGRLRLQLMTADLGETVVAAVELARPLAEEKHQSLTVTVPHTPCPARCDPARLRQVLLHLLSNAVKYTAVGGEIKVVLRPCAGEYCIYVRDNGCGVPAEQHETIFQRYYQSADDTGVRGLGGGLGLPLARALVQLHGGELCVASTGIAGEGSLFYFNLPSTRDCDPCLPFVHPRLPSLLRWPLTMVSEHKRGDMTNRTAIG